MKIDHIGYAVREIERAIISFSDLGFIFGEIIEDIDRNIKISFGEKDGYQLELVSALDRSKESPVDLYLSNIQGMPYHICFQSDYLDEEIATLEKLGFKIIIPPANAVAFENKRVAFLMNRNIGLMEIVEA